MTVGLGATQQQEGASSIYVPAEKVMLHQHVLNTLLQWLLFLLCTEQPQSRAGTTLELHRSFLQPRPHHSPPGKGNEGPTMPHTHLSLSRELPVLREAEGEAAEDSDEPKNSLCSCWASVPTRQSLPLTSKPAELPTHRSSHLIWTQPGLRRKDQGWYHFSTVGRLEQSTSSHRCNTCSLRIRQEGWD